MDGGYLKEEDMEKLSHILPTNRRISNVDLAGGAPVRPGAPSYGRPIGLSAKIRQERMDADRALKSSGPSQSSKLNIKDAVNISSHASQKVSATPIANSGAAIKVASNVANAIKSLSGAETSVPQASASAVIAPIDIVEDQLEAQIQKGQKVKAKNKIAEYPQGTRDLLNQTSIANQLVNELPAMATEIAQREDEEI